MFAIMVLGLLCASILAAEQDREAIVGGLKVAPIVAIGSVAGGASGTGGAMGGGGVTTHVVFSEVITGPHSLADAKGRTVFWFHGQQGTPAPPAGKPLIWFLRPSTTLHLFQDVRVQDPRFIEATPQNVEFLKQTAEKLATPADEIARGLIEQNHAPALNATKGTEEELIQNTAGMAKLHLNSIMLDETKTPEKVRLLYAILIVDEQLGLLRIGSTPSPTKQVLAEKKWQMGKRLLEIDRGRSLPKEVIESLAE